MSPNTILARSLGGLWPAIAALTLSFAALFAAATSAQLLQVAPQWTAAAQPGTPQIARLMGAD